MLWKIIFVVLFFCGTVYSVMIRKHPENVTSLLGTDVTFTCEVIEQGSSEFVFWKKVSHAGFTDVLSYNNVSMNTTKYSIRGAYTLVVQNVQVTDEAEYECQAGVDRARATLAVAVLMENMTLSLEVLPLFKSNSLVNLTCHVTHSRPPADIRWFHGNSDLTVLASSCQQIFDSDGFGDAHSILSVPIVKEAPREPYSCIASLPGVSVARTGSIYLPYTGTSSASVTTSSRSLLMLLYVTSSILTLSLIIP